MNMSRVLRLRIGGWSHANSPSSEGSAVLIKAGEASGKYCQSAQDDALILREDLVTPIERRPQRSVPGRGRPPAAAQHPETIVEARRKSPHPEGLDSSRRQFDRQRYSIELPADFGDNRSIRVGEFKFAQTLCRALDKQLYGRKGERLGGAGGKRCTCSASTRSGSLASRQNVHSGRPFE